MSTTTGNYIDELRSTSQTPFEDAPLCKVHVKAIAGAMGGQFTDGYIIGTIGIALSLATAQLQLSNFWIGLIAAGSLAGILCGSLISGFIVDRIGRKSIYSLTMWVFAVAAILQFFVTSPWQLLILRLLLGVAIGADYAVAISLVSELAPQRHRGRVMSSVMVAWVAGFVVAYIAGVYMESLGENAWRWVLASSFVPALITLVIRFGTPESPLWLLIKGRRKEAIQVIAKHFGSSIALPIVSDTPHSTSWSKLFSRKWRRNSFVGAAFYFCQVIPFFALGTFIPKVLQSINIEDANAGGIIYNIFLFIGVLIGVWVVEKVSRRAFLMASFYFCAATLLILTVWIGMPPWLVLVLFSAFALVMSGSTVLEYVYLPELFPTELRASGIGFSVAMSRLGAAGGTFLLPIMMANYGVQATLSSCVAALLLGGVICQLWAPVPAKTLSGDPH
jgi:MFS transporter, putative metabolite transport protein